MGIFHASDIVKAYDYCVADAIVHEKDIAISIDQYEWLCMVSYFSNVFWFPVSKPIHICVCEKGVIFQSFRDKLELSLNSYTGFYTMFYLM